jgi:hypothetical protein
MMRVFSIVGLLLLASPALADEAPPRLNRQVMFDLGLSVVHAGLELPVGDHLAVSVGAGIFGTYFLPWFDAGDDVKGPGGGVRATWFKNRDGRGLYVTPYVRASYVSGERDGMKGTGVAITSGLFAGWCFAVKRRFDVRIGAGAQYIYIDADPLGASTPFIGLDFLVGYRLR